MTTFASTSATAARRGRMLAVLLTGEVMATMDSSIVSVAAQTIRDDLHAGGAAIQLIVSGYLLTTGVLFVTCARIGDVVGQRRAFLLGLGWFTCASLLCGLAPDAATMVLARVGQGVGAALLTPQIFALIQLHWDGAARRRAIGLYSMVLALGVALGQVVGGLVVGADLFGLSWRPVFLLNVPIGVLLLVLGPRLLPDSRTDGRARLDPGGVAVLTVAMAAVTVPLIFGPDQGWPAWAWGSLGCGGVLLAGFFRHEARARHPLLDPAVLRPNELNAVHNRLERWDGPPPADDWEELWTGRLSLKSELIGVEAWGAAGYSHDMEFDLGKRGQAWSTRVATKVLQTEQEPDFPHVVARIELNKIQFWTR